ncbi:helix-turn-helix domain-containing protein [Bordetella petrii]|nr:helix-turn-helix domain-containing protein [Bordetella petrii]
MTAERQSPLERYLSILEIVAASQRPLSLTELANIIDLPKPTVHRLIGVLQACGALRTEERNQRGFLIGRRMSRLLHLSQDESVVANYAQIVCDRLTEKVAETSYVVRLGIDAVHTIARSVPDQGYRLHVLPGLELPAHAAASAKAIAAYQDDATQQRLLRPPFKRLTEFTKTTLEQVMAELERVRQDGYAICDREIDNGIMAYGCPVFLRTGEVIYSLGVTGPCSRLTERPAAYWIEALQESAALYATMLREGARLDPL